MAKKVSKDKNEFAEFKNLGGDLNVSRDLELDIKDWKGEAHLIGGSNPDKSPFNDKDPKGLKSWSKEFLSGGDLHEA